MREKYRSIYQAIYIYYEIITHAKGICVYVRGVSACVCVTLVLCDKCSLVGRVECRIGVHCVVCGYSHNNVVYKGYWLCSAKKNVFQFIHTILSVNREKTSAKSKLSEHYVDVHVDYVIAYFSLRFYRTSYTVDVYM